MRFTFFCLLFTTTTCYAVYAQHDTVPASKPSAKDSGNYYRRPAHLAFLDSVALASAQRQQFIADSLAIVYILPDSNRADQYTMLVLKTGLYKGHNFLDIPFNAKKK